MYVYIGMPITLYILIYIILKSIIIIIIYYIVHLHPKGIFRYVCDCVLVYFAFPVHNPVITLGPFILELRLQQPLLYYLATYSLGISCYELIYYVCSYY